MGYVLMKLLRYDITVNKSEEPLAEETITLASGAGAFMRQLLFSLKFLEYVNIYPDYSFHIFIVWKWVYE